MFPSPHASEVRALALQTSLKKDRQSRIKGCWREGSVLAPQCGTEDQDPDLGSYLTGLGPFTLWAVGTYKSELWLTLPAPEPLVICRSIRELEPFKHDATTESPSDSSHIVRRSVHLYAMMTYPTTYPDVIGLLYHGQHKICPLQTTVYLSTGGGNAIPQSEADKTSNML